MSAAARRWAIVPAAGRGSRFGARVPKQYLPLLDRPLLSWTLAALLAERSIAGVVVALADRDRRWTHLPEAKSPRVATCKGGVRREISVFNALLALEGKAADADWVLVHDAARPCVRREDLHRLFDACDGDPVGGLLAIPVGDTLKRADLAGRCRETVARDELWRAMTPQMFRYGLLKRALVLCLDRERPVTDEASAIEALGLRARLVRGHGDNVKVTHREDAALAAAILRSRRRESHAT
jgi:2-C-methyl-D-erythritol 4-phosphate cytidylyltransferase